MFDCFDWRSWRFIALFLATIFAAVATSDAAETAGLRVMSFNVRFAKAGHSEAANENNWNDPEHPRRDRAIRVIREAAPDLLVLQEARDGQISDLKRAFSEYDFYGVGRDDGKTEGEFSGIFYRQDRFTRKDAGSFWLSATPDKPGTTFSFNKLPRIASWVRLVDATTKREFVLLNMHWDHQDKAAREKSAALVRQRLATVAKGLPVIVVGDLNSTEETPAFKMLVAADAAGRTLADSYRERHPQRMPDESTFNGWNGRSKGSRIDFILHSAEFASAGAEILLTNYDGLWPSDHYPVSATLKLR